MSKPIFIVTLPKPLEMVSAKQIALTLEKELTGYHILVFTGKVAKPEFNVFYSKDMTHIQFDELKSIVENAVTS